MERIVGANVMAKVAAAQHKKCRHQRIVATRKPPSEKRVAVNGFHFHGALSGGCTIKIMVVGESSTDQPRVLFGTSRKKEAKDRSGTFL